MISGANNMTVRWALALVTATVFSCVLNAGYAHADEVEHNVNRPFGDYKDFPLQPSIAGFAPCQGACMADERCKAWTFAPSGVRGNLAHCWLKDSVPNPVPDKNFTSGVPVRDAGVRRHCSRARCLRCWPSRRSCRRCQPIPGCGAGGSAGLPADAQAILNAHNGHRAKHCVPNLTWSAQMAADAQAWANACNFAHSSVGGENLWMGSPSGPHTAKSASDSWYDEIRVYDFNNPRASYVAWQSDRSKEVRHFTQLVWRNTTQLGCAKALCGSQDYWVCRYSPVGNFNGQNPGVLETNVPRPCK